MRSGRISKDGYGRDWTPLRFPFSISVALAIYRKLTSPKIVQMSTMSDYPEMARQRELASLEIIEMAEVALQNKDRFVVLLIPRPQDSINPDAAFVSMLNGLAAQAPEACLIDPSKELRLAAVSLSTPDAIRTTTGHFSSAGNAALADALVSRAGGLRDQASVSERRIVSLRLLARRGSAIGNNPSFLHFPPPRGSTSGKPFRFLGSRFSSSLAATCWRHRLYPSSSNAQIFATLASS